MNQKTPYEVTITRKLEQLPLPNLQDSIWSRIKEQLDTDMPTDDGGNNTPGSPTAPDWRNLLGTTRPLLLVVAVVVSLLMLSKKRNRPAAPATGKPAVTRQTAPTVQSSDQGPPVEKTTIPYPVPGSTTPASDQSVGIPLPDTLTSTQPLVADQPMQKPADSALLHNPINLPVQPTPIPPKKNRGVSGITDGDYRLVPTNDSAVRKKND